MTQSNTMRLNPTVEEQLGEGSCGLSHTATQQRHDDTAQPGDDIVIVGCRGVTTYGAMRRALRTPSHMLNTHEEDMIGQTTPEQS